MEPRIQYAKAKDGVSSNEARSTTELARIFRRFGEVEARKVKSPLYEQFSYGVAEDPGIRGC